MKVPPCLPATPRTKIAFLAIRRCQDISRLGSIKLQSCPRRLRSRRSEAEYGVDKEALLSVSKVG